MEDITKEDIRTIVREEIERAINIILDAKITATAVKKGLFYSDAPLLSHSKSAPRRKSS